MAVLFDMDGTLVSSEHLSRRCAAAVMKQMYGLEVEPEEFIPFGGQGEARFLGGVAEKYGVSNFDVEGATALFFDIYINTYAKQVDISYPGAVALVQACKAAGLKTAVASSAGMVKVDANLKAAGFADSDFDAVVGADGFERIKPFPDIFVAAAQQVGVEPAACVVVEDAEAGVAAARAAGMRVVGLTTCLSDQEMAGLAPDLIRPTITQLSLEDLQSISYTQGPPGSSGSGSLISGSGSRQSTGAQSTASAASPSPAATAATPITSSNSSAAGPVGWLEQRVQLPRGNYTTRRDVLKLLPLGGAVSCLAVAGSRLQAMSYANPQALLQALIPDASAAIAGSLSPADERVAAFKRFIADLEARGGGQAVPDFAPGLDWLNSGPLSLRRQLAGKVVVLDFWTYCCINCMHVLPELAFLERKYAGRAVAVVGVHSAKFDNEKDSAAIREAVLRYDITHPVVNDANMVLWGQLGVSSWPTLLVVSPAGRVLGRLSGEGHQQDLDDFLAAALEYYGEAGQLDDSPLPLALERDKGARSAASALRYPGKLALDPAGGRLFISDSNNHRIVAVDARTGRFLFDVGGNGAGFLDGGFSSAAFNRLQGLAYSSSEDALYVADTENHALRKVDLARKTVTTLLGNGQRGSDYQGGGRGLSQQLNSPWGVALDEAAGQLYITMAGQHQIWSYSLASGSASNLSGNGYERNSNGPTGLTTSWAQPSGLALAADGRHAYVADSESSTVRLLDLQTGGSKPLVGGDPLFSDLFRFGDADGAGSNALLQHPLAVCVLAPTPSTGSTASSGAAGECVLVADSYNHKLKLLDPSTGSIITLAGAGRPGYADSSPNGSGALLSEPGGLAAAPDGRVYVADTNNSLIRVLEPASSGSGGSSSSSGSAPAMQLRTLNLTGVPMPRVSPLQDAGAPAGAEADGLPPLPTGVKLVVGPALPGRSGTIQAAIQLPRSYHLTRGTVSAWSATVVGAAAGVVLQPAAGRLEEGKPLSIAYERGGAGGGAAAAAGGAVRLDCKVYFCQDGGVCLFERVVIQLPLAAGEAGGSSQLVTVEHVVSPSAPAALPALA